MSRDRSRRQRLLGAVVYWLAVIAIALAIAVGFVAFLVSRDEASLDGDDWAGATTRGVSALHRRAWW